MESQQNLIKKRVKLYCQKTYKKMHETKTILKESTVCMRENSFYIDTIRSFRDRRYEFKNLTKVWKNKYEAAMKEENLPLAQDCMGNMVLYDSLQVLLDL